MTHGLAAEIAEIAEIAEKNDFLGALRVLRG